MTADTVGLAVSYLLEQLSLETVAALDDTCSRYAVSVLDAAARSLPSTVTPQANNRSETRTAAAKKFMDMLEGVFQKILSKRAGGVGTSGLVTGESVAVSAGGSYAELIRLDLLDLHSYMPCLRDVSNSLVDIGHGICGSWGLAGISIPAGALTSASIASASVDVSLFMRSTAPWAGSAGENRTISPVVGLWLQSGGSTLPVKNLSQPILISFSGLGGEKGHRNCVFWESGNNSAEGYSVTGVTTLEGADSNVVTCSTTHLSIFSIQVDN